MQGCYRRLLCTHIFIEAETGGFGLPDEVSWPTKRMDSCSSRNGHKHYSSSTNFVIPIVLDAVLSQERIFEMSATLHTLIDVGISKHIGKYSDAVEIPCPVRWLFTSGTPGLMPDGTLPATFEIQAAQAWENILSVLRKADMGPQHLLKIVQYLVRAEDLPAYGAIRARFLGDCRPASMLLVASALPKPGLLIEIEAIAAAL